MDNSWDREILKYYNIDSDLDNEGIIEELKRIQNILRQQLSDEYKIAARVKKGGKKSSDEILEEIDKISQVIIVMEGRVDLRETTAEIIQRRKERIEKNLEMQKRAKDGLNNMLLSQSKTKEVEATQKMLENVRVKIEVLQMQLKLLERNSCEKRCDSEEFVLNDMKYHLKIEEAIVNGANRAMQTLSKSALRKKSLQIANESVSQSIKKCNLLRTGIKDLTLKFRNDPQKKAYLENSDILESIPVHVLNSKVFRVTGTLNISIAGLPKKSYIVLLVDNKQVHRNSLPSFNVSVSVFKAKEIEFQLYNTDNQMSGVKYLLLEEFIDEKKHKLVVSLIPSGHFSANICLVNPLVNNTARLMRQNAKRRFGHADPPRKTSQSKIENYLGKYTLLKTLGCGNFGQVILCRDEESVYAMKIQDKQDILSRGEIDTLRVEMEVLKHASKTNNFFLVQLASCFTTRSHVCFVMEFVPGGDLMTLIQRKPFSIAQSIFYAACVLLGLKYLHQIEVLYRDLKLDNLMMCADGYVKIADFGLCKQHVTHSTTTSTFCGTPEFIAPEMLNSNHYTRAIDWWQFGILIYEMITMQPPFYGDDDEDLFSSIIHDHVDYKPVKYTPARDILTKLLVKSPSTRLGNSLQDADDVIIHPFFNTIDFNALETKSLKPPFKPTIASDTDVSNFDNEFTSTTPEILSSDGNLSEENNSIFDIFNF